MDEFVRMTCGDCGVVWGMNRAFYEGAKQAGPNQRWSCPNGHWRNFVHGPSSEDLLRKERDTLRQQVAQRDDEIARQRERSEGAERRASAARGQVTRLKNRAAAGVCPCCNRTFANLAKHMAGKHPTFRASEAAHA